MSETPTGARSWNDQVISEFRAGARRIADRFDRENLLLLHTTGARSGRERISPLAWLPDVDGGGRLLIVASAGGRPQHPSWYFNVVAHPKVSVEVWQGEELVTRSATATVADPGERAVLWAHITSLAPGFAAYESATDRVIPVVTLELA
jgi:deazaflavin-dependent oxidoreductase (nitroreductase family)